MTFVSERERDHDKAQEDLSYTRQYTYEVQNSSWSIENGKRNMGLDPAKLFFTRAERDSRTTPGAQRSVPSRWATGVGESARPPVTFKKTDWHVKILSRGNSRRSAVLC